MSRPQLTPQNPQAGNFGIPNFRGGSNAAQVSQVARSLAGLSQTLRGYYTGPNSNSQTQGEQNRLIEQSRALYMSDPEEWERQFEKQKAQIEAQRQKSLSGLRKLFKAGKNVDISNLSAFQNGGAVARGQILARQSYGGALDNPKLLSLEVYPEEKFKEIRELISEDPEFIAIKDNPFAMQAYNDVVETYEEAFRKKHSEFRSEILKEANETAFFQSTDSVFQDWIKSFKKNKPDKLAEKPLVDSLNSIFFVDPEKTEEVIDNYLIPHILQISSEGDDEKAKKVFKKLLGLKLNNQGATFGSNFTGDKIKKVYEQILEFRNQKTEADYAVIKSTIRGAVLKNQLIDNTARETIEDLVNKGKIAESSYLSFITTPEYNRLLERGAPIIKGLDLETLEEYQQNNAPLPEYVIDAVRASSASDDKKYQITSDSATNASFDDFQKSDKYEDIISGLERYLNPASVGLIADAPVGKGKSPLSSSLSFWTEDVVSSIFDKVGKGDFYLNEDLQQDIKNKIKGVYTKELRKRHKELVDAYKTDNQSTAEDWPNLEEELFDKFLEDRDYDAKVQARQTLALYLLKSVENQGLGVEFPKGGDEDAQFTNDAGQNLYNAIQKLKKEESSKYLVTTFTPKFTKEFLKEIKNKQVRQHFKTLFETSDE